MSGEIRLTESVTLQILQQNSKSDVWKRFCHFLSRKKKMRKGDREEYTDTVGLSRGLVSEGIIIIIT